MCGEDYIILTSRVFLHGNIYHKGILCSESVLYYYKYLGTIHTTMYEYEDPPLLRAPLEYGTYHGVGHSFLTQSHHKPKQTDRDSVNSRLWVLFCLF